ncbi:BQ5605_C001g00909 [Microbotryum silenes-dioicae]|uniref:BQ5605_C001g00909 protein n=1 Tax=Microbotryum silenes-dioicae TaxID=796604 RepID=A0A2X0M7X1_9BASI|nr:BQ5605_C001g00909 [Microbotryum silenes-dioicae]
MQCQFATPVQATATSTLHCIRRPTPGRPTTSGRRWRLLPSILDGQGIWRSKILLYDQSETFAAEYNKSGRTRIEWSTKIADLVRIAITPGNSDRFQESWGPEYHQKSGFEVHLQGVWAGPRTSHLPAPHRNSFAAHLVF